MSCNFVTSDFNTCTLHRAIEECFSSFTDSPAGLRQPSRFHLTLAPGIFCYWSFYLWGFWYAPWRGIVWLPSRSLEDEGKRGWEDTREPALFISLLSQGEGRGSPWGGKGQNILWSLLSSCALGFLSAHLSWQYLGSQDGGEYRGGRTHFQMHLIGYIFCRIPPPPCSMRLAEK